jgi:hypothetical protein
MKKFAIAFIIAILPVALFSQDLVGKYKTGKVKLIPDPEYARGNEWNQIFRSYYDTLYNKPMGTRKSLIMLPDGSVVVNHAYKDYHTRFSPAGTFEKEFSIQKAGQKPVMGVINSNTLYTGLDNMGKMTCTDLNGSFKKILMLNYMTQDIIALSNGKFAVVGWVIWAEKFRTFVSIVDYETNKEKVIWEQFEPRNFTEKYEIKTPFNYRIKLKNGFLISCNTIPYTQETGKGISPKIVTVNNELIVAIPNTGEILRYDLEGNLKSKNKINWANGSISVDEQKTIQQRAIDHYKIYIKSGNSEVLENQEEYKRLISEMETDLKNIQTPLAKPYFSNILKDSDGNVLFFEIPEEKNANVFHVWVYGQGGHFETECTFVCDEYDLDISSSKMVFHKGYLYGIQKLKEATGNPLRLVRYTLAGQ